MLKLERFRLRSFINSMNNVKLHSDGIFGEITVPSSKSFAHRALIVAALSGKKITIHNIIFSDDIKATINALENLGVVIKVSDDSVIVDGSGILRNSFVKINANESGSTLRFMIPVVLMLGNKAVFDGKGRLPERPLNDYFEIFDKNSVEYIHPNGKFLPLEVKSGIDITTFEVKGNVSSQFITGLMLCGMIKPVRINITTELQSKPYVDITVDVLRNFGCDVIENENSYEIIPKSTDINEYVVENDWSQAAFFMCAAAINGDITVNNINVNSVQGDRKIVDLLKEFGADVTCGVNCVNVKKSEMYGIDIDAGDIPDLVPVLSVLSCYARCRTRIYNASRLRLKESDRLKSMYDELSKLGADIEIGEDYLVINGCNKLYGNDVDSHNDHRVAMSMAVASVGCEGSIILNGYNAVNKSYPTFFEDWRKLNE